MKKKNSFNEIQSKINDWIRDHGDYWPPLSMLSAIMEELGEFSREVNYQEGFKPKKLQHTESKLEEELGDLLFSIVCIANYYKIDLVDVLMMTMKKYFKRDPNRFIK
ncbi:MAG: nucleotide pyrophosphohydrolase [Candidatus Lokiarchaeota archaeon]|nr:nucleotide pyrophosphohydrolase [Candidatus Lokiarchaeota archaeon]